jgi:hypothetical protein
MHRTATSSSRPLQGHHHLGRRKHFVDRGGGRALQDTLASYLPRWSPDRMKNGARRLAPFVERSPAMTQWRGGFHCPCRENLAHFKCPRKIVFCDCPRHYGQDPEIPLTRTGQNARLILDQRRRDGSGLSVVLRFAIFGVHLQAELFFFQGRDAHLIPPECAISASISS